MDELVRHSALLDAVESIIGPDILVYHLTCWIKEAGDGSFVSWHQDSTYFNLFCGGACHRLDCTERRHA